MTNAEKSEILHMRNVEKSEILHICHVDEFEISQHTNENFKFFFAIYTLLVLNLFCCDLRCFVANRFCHILRGFLWRKLIPKVL